MTARTIAQALASMVQARANCEQSGNLEWFAEWSTRIDSIMRDTAPSGSGIDSGTAIDLDRSNASRLVFTCEFHHMDECGMYDDWTSHTVTVRPAFSGIDITIGGRNRGDIKDYLHEVFYTWLSAQEPAQDKPPIAYVCASCGSPDVELEGWIRWNADEQRLEVTGLCDKGHYCRACDGETRVKTVPLAQARECDFCGAAGMNERGECRSCGKPQPGDG